MKSSNKSNNDKVIHTFILTRLNTERFYYCDTVNMMICSLSLSFFI